MGFNILKGTKPLLFNYLFIKYQHFTDIASFIASITSVQTVLCSVAIDHIML